MHATPFNLMGKTALITGSTGGIGCALAQGLARAGCDIVLHGLEEHSSVKHLQIEIERTYGVEVSYVRADLADVPAIVDMMEGLIHANCAESALITLHFRNGRTVCNHVETACGSLGAPLTDTDLERKLRTLCAWGGSGCDSQPLIDAVWSLQDQDDAGAMMLLAAGQFN
ncbi:MAG: SDR family NAD(P)-dependent oxidoreductase [Betaproteobacteria bacterium]|nr:SDR family NAD(P)-dependent oxidoreductase [Betaproteobacteria bacterium]